MGNFLKKVSHTLQKLSRKGESFQGLLVCTHTGCWDTEFVRSQQTAELLPRAAGPTSHPLHEISLPVENLVRTNTSGKFLVNSLANFLFLKKLARWRTSSPPRRPQATKLSLSFKAPEGGASSACGGNHKWGFPLIYVQSSPSGYEVNIFGHYPEIGQRALPAEISERHVAAARR